MKDLSKIGKNCEDPILRHILTTKCKKICPETGVSYSWWKYLEMPIIRQLECIHEPSTIDMLEAET